MKIALAQLNYTIGDIEGNKLKIIDAINKAKSLQEIGRASCRERV